MAELSCNGLKRRIEAAGMLGWVHGRLVEVMVGSGRLADSHALEALDTRDLKQEV